MTDISHRKRKPVRKLRSLLFYLAAVAVGVLMLAGLFIVMYARQFSGGLSDKQEIWGFFGDYVGGVLSVILSGLSLLFALYVLLKTNQDKRLDQIYRFTDEFRSDEMSLRLKLLWDFYEYDDFRNRRERYTLSEPDKREMLKTRYKFQHEQQTDVYLARRSVSYFFLHLAIFLENNRLDEKGILTLWPSSSISTLQTIVVPCEEALTAPGVVPDKLVHFNYLLERWQEFDKEVKAKRQNAT